MHHLCALGSLSRFRNLSPIFCEALLSGVVTFASFCRWEKITVLYALVAILEYIDICSTETEH